MIELALTRIFSVVMHHHFAFLAISIALFGLSASGVFAYCAAVARPAADLRSLLSGESGDLRGGDDRARCSSWSGCASG